MSAVNYIDRIKYLIQKLEDTQLGRIKEAAAVFARTIKNDGIIHVFGTGHSHILAIEMFVRAGGLAPINAMLDSTVLTNTGARKSGDMERLSGLAEIIWEQYDIRDKDVMVIISNSGRNVVPVEMALLARDKGLYLIAVTSINHSQNCDSRHAGGKKLYQLADLVIDNQVPYGDGLLDIKGIKTGPASTIAGSLIVNSIVSETLNILAQEDCELPVYTSQNVDGYNNDELYERYKCRVKHI